MHQTYNARGHARAFRPSQGWAAAIWVLRSLAMPMTAGGSQSVADPGPGIEYLPAWAAAASLSTATLISRANGDIVPIPAW